MPRIKAKIRNGVVTMETEGFTGDACLAATERVKRALGGRVLSELPTDEMYRTSATKDLEQDA